jgi:hypothetical protein
VHQADQAGSQGLKIHSNDANYKKLTHEEIQTCQTLRIYPAQYLNIKQVLLQAVETYRELILDMGHSESVRRRLGSESM